MSEGMLGIIAYLDTTEVDNLLASIEGGLVDQFIERFKESKVRKGEGKIGLARTGIEAGVESVREEAREAIRKTTPVSRLTELRRILIENDYVRFVNAVNIELRNELVEGELVEVYGDVVPSAFGEFVDIAVEFLEVTKEFSGLFGDAVQIDPQVEQGIRYLKHVTSKGIPILISCPPYPNSEKGFRFASILNPNCLMTRKENLRGKYYILGRVSRILSRNEVVYLYELIPGMPRLSRAQFKSLMKSLSGKPVRGFDVSIKEQDLRIKYPAVIVSPIAMYS